MIDKNDPKRPLKSSSELTTCQFLGYLTLCTVVVPLLLVAVIPELRDILVFVAMGQVLVGGVLILYNYIKTGDM